MSDVTISLPAMEAHELMRERTPDGVWMRNTGYVYGHGAEEIELRGPPKAVLDFIAAHWGDETARSEYENLLGQLDDEQADYARTVADDSAWYHEMVEPDEWEVASGE